MVHIVDPHLSKPDKRYSYTLGFRYLKRTREVYQSLDVREEILDCRFGGRLTIPEQLGVRGNEENARDNEVHGLLDPITWVEDMAAGLNTSQFDLYHPTIETNEANHYRLHGNPTIENNFLKLQVAAVGSPPAMARGLYVKLDGSSPRIYKAREITGTTWYLLPGRLPWSTVTQIGKADSLRFRLLNPNDIDEYLDYNTRGPYNMEYIETR